MATLFSICYVICGCVNGQLQTIAKKCQKIANCKTLPKKLQKMLKEMQTKLYEISKKIAKI